jgi:D-alanyl-D-alanine carboxypeptidase
MAIRPFCWLRSSAIVALVVVSMLLLGVGANPALAGYAAIVVDQTTGEVIHERHADDQNYPASLTKMMTLYMVFTAIKNGRLKLDTPLAVSANASTQSPSKVGLKDGDTIKVEDAILALVTKSANDVAVVVAEALAGSEERFAEAMTKRARALGMTQTTFRNASGLPDSGQVSSARDLARLAIALRRDYPTYYRYFSTASFDYNGASFINHNKLLGRYDGVDGIKTGFTQASGFNLVASAERDGRRLVAIVMGGDTAHQRDRQVMKLLDGAFGVAPMPRDLKVADRGPAKVTASAERKAKTKRLVSKALDLAPQREADAMRTSKKGYAIQVGAYDTKGEAHKALEKVSHKVGALVEGSERGVSKVKLKRGKTLYRAAFSGLSKNDADKACKKLTRTKVPCLVIAAGPAKGDVRVATLSD